MYEPNLSGLGFSLKPPAWLRNLAGAVVKGTTATIPTPAGPVVVDLGNPQSVAAAKAAITGTKFSTTMGNKPTSPAEQLNASIQENVPGGWLTIAALVIGGVFVLPKLLRRR